MSIIKVGRVGVLGIGEVALAATMDDAARGRLVDEPLERKSHDTRNKTSWMTSKAHLKNGIYYESSLLDTQDGSLWVSWELSSYGMYKAPLSLVLLGTKGNVTIWTSEIAKNTARNFKDAACFRQNHAKGSFIHTIGA